MTLSYKKTKDQILTQILQSLQKNADVTATHPGSIARAFAEAIAVEVGDLYESLKFSIDQSSLATAKGRALDLIGELYSVRRRPITIEAEQDRASFNIEFYIPSVTANTVIIPKDTLVYNDVTSFSTRQYQYKLVDSVAILPGTVRAYGRVVANFQGNDFVASVGSLTKHNFVSSDVPVVFCVNPKEVYPVTNMESDDLFRLRISRAIKQTSYGTNESLRISALAIPGVRDVRVRESSYGMGSCDVIIVPESQRIDVNLIQNINETLASKKPVGIRLNIRIAERRPINLAVNIVLPSGLSDAVVRSVESQASLFIKRYLNSLTIGSAISFAEIEAQARAASDFVKSVNILSASINGQEIPKGVFRINSEREYMIAGAVSVFSVIMS